MSSLKTRRELAAKVAGVGVGKVRLDLNSLDDIKEAITKADIRSLIRDGAIKILQKEGTSKYRARKRHIQRKKGLQKGAGRRKGKAGARTPKKRTWINKIRVQRKVLKALRDKKKINTQTYRNLYMKSKGNFFRSKKHLLLYMTQQGYLKGGKK